jgi:DNA polymerase elongation subunit (family B)
MLIKETKIQLPLPFNKMYWQMLNKTIEYNIRDSELLVKLENKLQHIGLLAELRDICNMSYESGMSSFGRVDTLVISFLKNKGLASKNSTIKKKEKFSGAFVWEPIPGIYDNVVDFDFASLYPNLIRTYNIGLNNFICKLKNPKQGYIISYVPFEDWPENFDIIEDPTLECKEVKYSKEELKNKIENENLIVTINGCFFTQHAKQLSSFFEICDLLLSSRSIYKNKMLEAIEKKDILNEKFYDTKQLVYKVLANSLYGVMSNKLFRFFDISCASAITLSGQEALKTSIIHGDAFMKYLDTKEQIKEPEILSSKEIFDNGSEKEKSEIEKRRKINYIVTGDTDSIFCYFGNFQEKKSVDNIKLDCNEIQDYLNKEVMVKLIERHHVTPEKNHLKLKNELIISRGLFNKKKKYGIRIISKEGIPVDKIVIMGLENKRSDYPNETKKFLDKLCDIILKSEIKVLKQVIEYKNLQQIIFQNKIINGEKTIAKPVSFTKKINEYKMIPQGVHAMLNWNKIVYDIHDHGTKAYMYKVIGIDRNKAPKDIIEKYEQFIKNGNKLEVIAIPDEESKLPDYFIPDVNGMMKTFFEDRFTNLTGELFKEASKTRMISLENFTKKTN